MKKKIFLLVAAGAVLAAAAVMLSKRENPYKIPESAYTSASNVSERMEYFALHGWEVEEICCKNITIPENFSDIYEEYAQIQDSQGMPLREYAGENAELYIYQVKNYNPENKNLLAELLVCDGTAVASMIYSDDGGSLKMAVS